MSKGYTQIVIKLPNDVADRLRTRAKENDRSMTAEFTNLIRQHVKDLPPTPNTKRGSGNSGLEDINFED